MMTMMITKMASVKKIKGSDGSEESIKSKKAITAPKILAFKNTTSMKTKNFTIIMMMMTSATTIVLIW